MILLTEVLALVLFLGCMGTTLYCALTGNGLVAIAVGFFGLIIGLYGILELDKR